MTTTTETPGLDAEQLQAYAQSLADQLALAEFKLTCVGHVAEIIDYAPSPVWTGQATAMTLRDFLGCNSIDEIKELAARKRSNA